MSQYSTIPRPLLWIKIHDTPTPFVEYLLLSSTLFEDLRRQNPWWRGHTWESTDRQLSALARARFSYDPKPLAGIRPGNVYSLLGPRRVGKSTAAKNAIRRLLDSGYPPLRVVYHSCDLLTGAADIAALLSTVYDEAELAGSLAGPDQPFFLFLDEIQRVPDWQQAIKHLHDTHRLGDDCVVLTGSSARDLRAGSELLPGRRGRALDRDRLLLPMSFRDFVTAVEPGVTLPPGDVTPTDLANAYQPNSHVRKEFTRPRIVAALDHLVELFELYSRIGGFPGAVGDYLRTGEIEMATMTEMWDVIRGDLNRYQQVRDATIPLKILERLALNLASPVSWQKIAREAAVDIKTVQTYVDLFTDAYLFLVVHRSDEGTLARRADKKIYPVDPLIAGMAAVATGRPRFVPDISLAAESILGVSLFRAVTGDDFMTFGIQQGVLYHRTGTNREVDFIVGRDRVPFESKYGNNVERRDAQVMERSFGRGVLMTRRTLNLDGASVLIPAPLVLAALRNSA